MIVKELKIINFRPYDEEGVTIRFEKGINAIVGTNNVGKSNILLALRTISGEEKLTIDDYHQRNTSKEIEIELTVELDSKEIGPLAKAIFNELTSKELELIIKALGKEVKISNNRQDALIWNKFLVTTGKIQLANDKPFSNYDISRLEKFYTEFRANYSIPIIEKLEEIFMISPIRSMGILLAEDPISKIKTRIKTKIRIFSEIRQCTEGMNEEVTEAYDGHLLPDVLSKLKNGTRLQTKKWELIKAEFNKMFPNLILDVRRPKHSNPAIIEIYDESKDCDLKIESLGTGIWEILIFLTHFFRLTI